MDEYFGGILKFDGLIGLILCTITIIYFYGWFIEYKKSKILLSYWRMQLLLFFLIPFVLEFPFLGSDLNLIFIGDNIYYVQDNLSLVYFYSLLGFFFVWLGKYLCDKYLHSFNILSIFIKPVENVISKKFVRIVNNNFSYYLIVFIYFMFFMIFMIFIINSQLIGNPRKFFMENAAFRPLYNFFTTFFYFASTIIFTRILCFSNLSDKILLGFVLFTSLFFGIRSPIVFQSLSFFVLYVLYFKKGILSLRKLLLTLFLISFLVFVLVSIRNSDVEKNLDIIDQPLISSFAEFFYGNTFSDYRDFAWLMGVWDGNYLYGKTYLSAFISFIPSSLSEFREISNFGRISVNMIQGDVSVHPGLRPGLFGESYFNFGIFGVITIGVIWGYVNRYIDLFVNIYFKEKKAAYGCSLILAGGFANRLPVSAAFFEFYILLLLIFLFFYISLIFE